MNKIVLAGDRLFLKFPKLDYFYERVEEIQGKIVSTKGFDDKQFADEAADADAVILIARNVSREIISGMEKCKLIMTLSVGYDCVDVQAATENGIPVCNSPTYCSDDVANHSMMLILALSRKLHLLMEETNGGGWDYKVSKPVYNYTGKTLGIIGFGKIGRKIVPKAKGFGMKVAAYDPYIADDIFELLGVERKYELADLLPEADYLTVHAPLTGETEGMIDKEALALMKKDALIVNTARGAIIDEEALAEALNGGRIAGAGVDVLVKEPPTEGHPLIKCKNAVVTPHVAWYSEESFEKNVVLGMDELLRVLQGRRPRYIVNPEIFGK
jgi:D-3-phosphoglycerate dehydrogenase / 2-oxoglutarate reductase